MDRGLGGPCLCAVFVDYDNIYSSLRRKNEEAAKRFAKDATGWLKQIEHGKLVTPTNGLGGQVQRRIVLSRCYGNPVPRRTGNDNNTDMNSFPFVRHHFVRAGYEVVDCPPLTPQLKNSADIRIVMDVRDLLEHPTYFDEFIILSGEADFTPLLHRLRNYARRTVIYVNEFTAVPYTAICDGEIRELDLVNFLIDGQVPETLPRPSEVATLAALTLREADRSEIVRQVVDIVRASDRPLAIEQVAERTQATLGHEKTIGTNWAGYGAFRALLADNLPRDLRITDDAPVLVYSIERHEGARRGPMLTHSQDEPIALPIDLTDAPMRMPVGQSGPVGQGAAQAGGHFGSGQPASLRPIPERQPERAPLKPETKPEIKPVPRPQQQSGDPRAQAQGPAEPRLDPNRGQPQPDPQRAPEPQRIPDPQRNAGLGTIDVQRSIARIHEASQVPPLSPPEYRLLFEIMAAELTQNGLTGVQTVKSIGARAKHAGLELRREDIEFVLDVVGEVDPWFEQGASANLFAGRFRNFVVDRCRKSGLNLAADEVDLIDAWFVGGGQPKPNQRHGPAASQNGSPSGAGQAFSQYAMGGQSLSAAAQDLAAGDGPAHAEHSGFPRIISQVR